LECQFLSPATSATRRDRGHLFLGLILSQIGLADRDKPPSSLKLSQSGRIAHSDSAGQPPTLQGTGHQAVQVLGKLLNFHEDISPNRHRAARVFCRVPHAGFSGPIQSVNLTAMSLDVFAMRDREWSGRSRSDMRPDEQHYRVDSSCMILS